MRTSWNRASRALIACMVLSLAAIAGAPHEGVGANSCATGRQVEGWSQHGAAEALPAILRPPKAPDREPRWSATASAGSTDNQKSKNVWRGADLNLLAVGMAVADVTGDGKNDIVLIDPNTVYLYDFVDKRMILLSSFNRSAMEFKSVDASKTRKMGPARIYVTAQNRGALASFVLEFRGGKLVPVIENIPYYLRIVDYPTQGPILLGQRKGLYKMYDGPIYRMEDNGEALKRAGRFGTPLKIPIFGFTVTDLDGSRKPVIAVYDRDEHLRLYRPNGKRFFLSRDYYGGSDVVLRRSGPEGRREARANDAESENEYYRPRIASYDIDKSGAYTILAITHVSKTRRYFSRMKMLGEGQVVGLEWNGDTLVKKWSTPSIQGMITDFAVADLPGLTGKRLIAVERKKTDWLSMLRSQSQLRAYDLQYLIKRGSTNGSEVEPE